MVFTEASLSSIKSRYFALNLNYPLIVITLIDSNLLGGYNSRFDHLQLIPLLESGKNNTYQDSKHLLKTHLVQ